jgi:[histone H3]-lysine36 N-dimethyltransferase SETMAR
MSAIIVAPASCEVRAVIRFLCAKGSSAAEIHRELCLVYGPTVMSEGKVRQWCRDFKTGRTNVHDEERSGRPSMQTDEIVSLVDQKLRCDRRLTISALADEFPHLGRTTVYTIVTEKLGYHKLCARWVPKMLTDQHKEQRMSSGREFLNRYRQDGDDLFSHIVTGDETWISYINPETKQQSMQWRHSTSPKPKKFKQTPYTSRKMMATVFWDEKGVLLVDFMERGTTITADVYCETLNKLRRAIQNRRRGKLSSGVILLHDNARPHTAAKTQEKIQDFRWELFNHPPYSPDLAPSDYFLFLHFKRWLGGQRFENDKEIKNAVENWFNSQAVSFYAEGLRKLVQRYEKCLEVNGDYVEK